MTACDEARFFLTQWGLNQWGLNQWGLNGLDGDKDETPCKALCKGRSSRRPVSLAFNYEQKGKIL